MHPFITHHISDRSGTGCYPHSAVVCTVTAEHIHYTGLDTDTARTAIHCTPCRRTCQQSHFPPPSWLAVGRSSCLSCLPCLVAECLNLWDDSEPSVATSKCGGYSRAYFCSKVDSLLPVCGAGHVRLSFIICVSLCIFLKLNNFPHVASVHTANLPAASLFQKWGHARCCSRLRLISVAVQWIRLVLPCRACHLLFCVPADVPGRVLEAAQGGMPCV